MADTVNSSTSESTDGKDSGDTSTATDTFKPIKTQDDLNQIISDRVARERAKFKDYADLKSKASKLDQIEKQNQTEAEKVAERIAKADTELAAIPTRVAEQLRTHLVAIHGIPADDAELFLTSNDPEVLLKQVARLMSRDAEKKQDQKKQGNRVPKEGTQSNVPQSDERETVRNLFAG